MKLRLIFVLQINFICANYFSNYKLTICFFFIIFTGEQNIIHHVSKDTIFNGYIFSLGYYLVLQPDGNHECLYPSFIKSILNTKNDSDSKIAMSFKRVYDLIYHITEEYKVDATEQTVLKESVSQYCLDGMSDDLRAHGAKKLGVQRLGDLLNITIQDISMRAGWVLKSFNTFFDYWVGSLPASVRSGKMISGWTTMLNQGIHGGNPPNMSAIRTDKEKVLPFVKHLLGRHVHIDEEVQLLIVANLLRHWDETIDVISNEPKGNYIGEKLNTHPFVHSVHMSMAYNDISHGTFKLWVEEVRHDFISKNIFSMTPKELSEIGYECQIDVRSFMETVKGNTDE